MNNTALTNFRMQLGISLLAVLLFGLKLLAWVYTGSVAVLTDALESIVNMVAADKPVNCSVSRDA